MKVHNIYIPSKPPFDKGRLVTRQSLVPIIFLFLYVVSLIFLFALPSALLEVKNYSLLSTHYSLNQRIRLALWRWWLRLAVRYPRTSPQPSPQVEQICRCG